MKLPTFAIAILLIGATSAQADVIKLVGSLYCPLICEDDENGFMVEIVRSVVEKNGHTLDYENLPRSRALDLVEAGQVDGLVGQVKGFEETYFYPDEQTGVINPCVFTSKSNDWVYDGSDSLAEVRMGLIPGYGYAAIPGMREHVAKYADDPDKVEYVVGQDPMLRILKMISLGRFTATLDDINIVNYLVKVHDLDDVRVAGCLEAKIDSYTIFPKVLPKSEQWATMLGDGIRELRASGELARILEKYGASDWQNSSAVPSLASDDTD